MGLASSQARILLLTAQKSDLEYRAQVINQRKLNLSNQTQALSERYSRAINNRKLTFALFGAENDVRRDLSYSDLRAENGNTGTYLITDKEGKYIVRNQADQESIFLSLVATGDYEKTAEDYNRFVQNCNKTYYSDNNGQKTLLDNNKFFQDSLRNGSLFIQQLTTSSDGMNYFQNMAYSSIATIYDEYDSSDDARAQAEYETQSKILANQDKMMDLELQQIQTKHKAVETEYDSVKKVIEKNIEVSFKIFS